MRIAVLDDYLTIVDRLADWSEVRARAELEIFDRHLGYEDQVAATLADFEIVVAQRERTQFPGSLLERLPKLKGTSKNAIFAHRRFRIGLTIC